MKIIFVDGDLLANKCRLYDRVVQAASTRKGFCHWNTVLASDGYTRNRIDLNRCQREFFNDDDYFIVTNSLVALMDDYGWNAHGAYWDIYIWNDERNDFYGVQTLTDRELKLGHSICKMYINGEFN